MESRQEYSSWFRFVEDTKVPRIVKIWLITGLVMIFFQIVIGGITRLTGSGLSITKWEVVTGSLPPLSEAAWGEAFDLYKATPQYQKINQGMSLSDFKFIYFWEYFHRLWARLMFFVFVIPFGIFLVRGMFSRRLVPRLLWVVALAGLEGFFGWIMVASGLIKRPWVNAYNLTLHLCMALVIFSYLLYTTFIAYKPQPSVVLGVANKRLSRALVLLAFVQIALGAMMSGSKAGLSYPTWPDMNGTFLPAVLTDGAQWQAEHFIQYDKGQFMVTLIQFLHRNVAYLLSGLVVWFAVRNWRTNGSAFAAGIHLMLGMLLMQVILGVLTIVNCVGYIPVALGVLHQAGAVLLLSSILYVNYSGKAQV